VNVKRLLGVLDLDLGQNQLGLNIILALSPKALSTDQRAGRG
jgi:hypothetical protein